MKGMGNRLLVITGAALFTIACSGGGSNEASDGGAAGASGSAGMSATTTVDPPALPERPAMVSWACPAGWLTETVLAGTPEEHSACQPPPPPTSCPDGMRASLGQTDCVTIGDACPAGLWPVGLPGATIVYVAPGGSGDGSGPMSPTGDLASAVANAPTGGIVALSKGTHVANVAISSSVTLWGACAAQTVIEAETPSDITGTVEVAGQGGVTLRNVKITGERAGVWVRAAAQQVDLSGVWVDRARRDGVIFSTFDGTACGGVPAVGELTDVAVTGTRPRASDGRFGLGLVLECGATVMVNHAAFEGNRTAAINAVDAGTSLTLTDVIIRDTLSEEVSGLAGRGLAVTDGARATVERALLQSNRDVGVGVGDSTGWPGPSGELVLTDVVVRDTEGQAVDNQYGDGIFIQGQPRVEMTRVVVAANRASGITALGRAEDEAGPTIELTDVVVRDTKEGADGRYGRGVDVNNGTRLTAVRLAVIGNRDVGIFAGTEDGRPSVNVELRDVVVNGTASAIDGSFGAGVLGQGAGMLGLERVVISDNAYAGIVASRSAVVRGSDVTVTGTRLETLTNAFGRGVQVQAGATVTVTRMLVDRNHELGITVQRDVAGAVGPDYQPAKIDLTDLTIVGTLASGDGFGGRGLHLQDGAEATLVRAELSENREAAIVLEGSDALLNASHLTIATTLERECAPSRCVDGLGSGLVALGGSFVVSQFAIIGSAYCGVQLRGGEGDLSNGIVSQNRFTASFATPGFDTSRLEQNVLFLDNESATPSTEFVPVPDNPFAELEDGAPPRP